MGGNETKVKRHEMLENKEEKKNMTKTNSQMKEKKKDETEQIDNFIFIGYQMEFILVISLFIHTK